MHTKSKSLLLTSYNTLQSFNHSPYHQSKTSFQQRRRRYPPPSQVNRHYATISNDYGDPLYTWPSPKPPDTLVTPYQILNHSKNAPYSKARFYQLVKIYHPDYSCQHYSSIPEAVRLERYHLIIAAHHILSDPTKRRAYDCYGLGWGTSKDNDWQHPHKQRRDGRPWPKGGNIMRNATWEDWERFYRQRDGNQNASIPPKPMISNTAFAGLLIMLAALSGIAEVTRASSNSQRFIEHRDAVHEKCSKYMARRRSETRGMDRDERIERFVKYRDPAAVNDEKYRKVLLDPDMCTSTGREGQNSDLYRKFPNPKTK